WRPQGRGERNAELTTQQQILAQVPLFSRLEPASLAALGQVAVARRYDAGAEIVTEGEGGVAFFLITDGTAAVVHPGRGASATLTPGASFGEMALLDGQPRSATIRAVTSVTCLALTRWEFLAQLRTDPEMAVALLGEMSGRVRSLEARIAELEGRTPR